MYQMNSSFFTPTSLPSYVGSCLDRPRRPSSAWVVLGGHVGNFTYMKNTQKDHRNSRNAKIKLFVRPYPGINIPILRFHYTCIFYYFRYFTITTRTCM